MSDRSRTALSEWGDVRFFLALARTGSLSAAARLLRVNHATVARRIRALEAALGHPLFQRRADGYVLTAQGRKAMDDAQAMERAAVALVEGIGSAIPEGVVRLATIRSLADVFLTERLGDLRRRHPRIVLEIVTDRRVVSLARREADVALRIGRPVDSTLVGRRLATLRYAFYAAPEHAATAAAPSLPAIGYGTDETGAIEAAWIERRFADRAFALRIDSPTGQAAAARAGLGVALLPRYLGGRDGGLVEVDLGPVCPPRELWLLCPSELSRMPHVRVVLDAITCLIDEHRPCLE